MFNVLHFVGALSLNVLKLSVSSGPALEAGWVGCGFDQPDPVKNAPVHGRGVGLSDL